MNVKSVVHLKIYCLRTELKLKTRKWFYYKPERELQEGTTRCSSRGLQSPLVECVNVRGG